MSRSDPRPPLTWGAAAPPRVLGASLDVQCRHGRRHRVALDAAQAAALQAGQALPLPCGCELRLRPLDVPDAD